MTKVVVMVLIFESDNCPTGCSWKVVLNVSVSSTTSSSVIFIVIMMFCGYIDIGPVALIDSINVALT